MSNSGVFVNLHSGICIFYGGTDNASAGITFNNAETYIFNQILQYN